MSSTKQAWSTTTETSDTTTEINLNEDQEPVVTIDGNSVLLSKAMSMQSKGTTSIEIRNIEYQVKVPENSDIQTVKTMFQKKQED